MENRIRQLRQERSISQQTLGDAIGVSQQTIYKYEVRNTQPDYRILIKIADYFDTSVDYILGVTDIRYRYDKVKPGTLSDEEFEIINLYRQSSEPTRKSVRDIMRNEKEHKKQGDPQK